MHTDKDDSLRQALEDLAPPVEEGGVWGYLQTKVAARRLRRRRRLLTTGAVAATVVCLGFAVFAAVHWWPRQSQILVVDDGPMVPNTGAAAQTQTDSDGTWERLALPPTGDLVCLALVMDPDDPAVLYAGTEDGLLISTDGAATWSRQWAGRYVPWVVIDPGPPSLVYVTAPDDQGKMHPYRSQDGGATWMQLTWPGEEFQGPLWIDTSVSPGVLYASNQAEPYGLYRSTDSGSTWTAVSQSMDLQIFGLVGSTLFARPRSDLDTGLLRSSDGGATWEAVQWAAASPPVPYSLFLRNDPSDPDRIYLYGYSLASSRIPPGLTVSTSSDGARTWSEVTGEDLDRALALAAAAPGTPASAIDGAAGFLAGYLESDASLFEALGSVPSVGYFDAPGFVIDPNEPSVLYVATGTGVHKSTDLGITWSDTTTAIGAAPSVYKVCVDPLTPTTLYVAMQGSLCRSVDRGATFTSLLADTSVWDIAIAPSSPSTLYAFTESGLTRSEDAGATWSSAAMSGLIAEGWGYPLPGGFLVSSQSALTILLYTADGIYRSADGGDYWEKATGLPEWLPESTPKDAYLTALPYYDSTATLLFEDPADPSTLFTVRAVQSEPAIGSVSAGVYSSTDGGLTWNESAGLDAGDDRVYLPIAIGPGDPLTVYARKAFIQVYEQGGTGYSSDDAVWRSIDAGATWEESGREGLDYIENLFMAPGSPEDGSALYTVATLPSSDSEGFRLTIYRSTDRGDSWERLCDLPEFLQAASEDQTGASSLQSLTIASDGTIYARTGRGVYRWTPAAGEPPDSSTEAPPVTASPTTATPVSPVVADGTWELRVDRSLLDAAAFGEDALATLLPETAYSPVEDDVTYRVTVGDESDAVTIEASIGGDTSSFRATRDPDVDAHQGCMWYDLDLADSFAGGRFVIWETPEGLQAEFTLYGSGLPIIHSVRGALVGGG